jgi:hypothetical protein
MPPEIVDLNDYQVAEWPTTPEGEQRQVREVLQHYHALFAHPLVEGITWWDLSDGGWLNAPAGLIRKDGSSKPAYDELLKLVKGDWWLSPTSFTTDSKGEVRFSGFLGDYELTHGGKQKSFSITKENAASLTIEI